MIISNYPERHLNHNPGLCIRLRRRGRERTKQGAGLSAHIPPVCSLRGMTTGVRCASLNSTLPQLQHTSLKIYKCSKCIKEMKSVWEALCRIFFMQPTLVTTQCSGCFHNVCHSSKLSRWNLPVFFNLGKYNSVELWY